MLKLGRLLAVATVASAMGALAISFLAQHRAVRSSPLPTTDQPSLDALVAIRFQGFEFKAPLNFSASVTVVAIPMYQSPVREMKELESGWTTIGGLYVPAGSQRLKLGAGAYRVELSKTSGSWRVHFTDNKGTIRGEVPAVVEPAEAAQAPFVTDEHSVCYRFDKTKVCV